MQKYDKKIFAFTQQSNSNFLEFSVDNFLNLIYQGVFCHNQVSSDKFLVLFKL